MDLAIINYLKSLSKDNTNINIKKKLACCYHTQKNYTDALKYYDEILLADKEDYDTKANKALILHAMGKYDNSISLYKELLAKQPNVRLQANLESALTAQGDLFLEKGEYQKAVPYFNEVISYDVNEAYAYYGLAKAYEHLNSVSKALENYEKAMETDSDNKFYKEEYKRFREQKEIVNKNSIKEEKTKEILKPSEKEILSNPIESKTEQNSVKNEKNLIQEGDEFYNKKDYDSAIKKYIQSLELNKDNSITCLKLGNLYKLKKDIHNASIYYQKAVSISPAYADAWFNLGLIYAEDGNYTDCKKCLNKVISLNPNYTYAYYAMGLAYEAENNKEKALEYYQKFVELDKDIKTKQDVINKINSLK